MIEENIKYFARLKGMQIGEIAARLNVTRQTLHNQTTGNPSAATLERIAAALQIPAWKLLHPDPASIPDDQPGALSLLCPYCKKPIYLHAAPIPETAPRPATLEDETTPDPDGLKESTQAGGPSSTQGPQHDQPAKDQNPASNPARLEEETKHNAGTLF